MTITNPYRLRQTLQHHIGEGTYDLEMDTIGALLAIAFAAHDYIVSVDSDFHDEGTNARLAHLRTELGLLDWRDR